MCSSKEGDPITANKFSEKANGVIRGTLKAFVQEALGTESMEKDAYDELLLDNSVTDTLHALLACSGDHDKPLWLSLQQKLLTTMGDAR